MYTKSGEELRRLNATPVAQYLKGDKAAYAAYHAHENDYDVHSESALLKLIESIKTRGYDESTLIVVFNSELAIRDGQHRAAVLMHLQGDMPVRVLNIVW